MILLNYVPGLRVNSVGLILRKAFGKIQGISCILRRGQAALGTRGVAWTGALVRGTLHDVRPRPAPERSLLGRVVRHRYQFLPAEIEYPYASLGSGQPVREAGARLAREAWQDIGYHLSVRAQHNSTFGRTRLQEVPYERHGLGAGTGLQGAAQLDLQPARLSERLHGLLAPDGGAGDHPDGPVLRQGLPERPRLSVPAADQRAFAVSPTPSLLGFGLPVPHND